MDEFKLVSTISALATVISANLSIEELTLVASIFVQLGDTLATIAARKGLCGNKS